jgi:hypothetical protein
MSDFKAGDMVQLRQSCGIDELDRVGVIRFLNVTGSSDHSIPATVGHHVRIGALNLLVAPKDLRPAGFEAG